MVLLTPNKCDNWKAGDPGPLLTHWVASRKELKSSWHHFQRVWSGHLAGGQWPVRSEAWFSGETKSVETKPFAGVHCLECYFVAGFKVAMPKGGPKHCWSLRAEATGWNLSLKRGAVPSGRVAQQKRTGPIKGGSSTEQLRTQLLGACSVDSDPGSTVFEL